MDLVALAQKAQDILAKHGGSMTLRDAASGATYTVFGVLPPPGRGIGFEGGTLVMRGGERAKIEAKGLGAVVPLVGWFLVVNGTTYRITRVNETRPDGVTAVVYDLELAR